MVKQEKTTRMSGADRRELILDAATRAFARTGYAATSTDAIAREAGVSQPYVVRMFGSKAELFREVFDRSMTGILEAFDSVSPTAQGDALWEEMGRAYTALLTDRDLLLVMLHGFAAGDDAAIGAQARAAMSAVYRQIRAQTDCTPDEARQFIAQGMLLNTLLAMQVPEHVDEDDGLRELAVCAFGGSLDAVIAAGA